MSIDITDLVFVSFIATIILLVAGGLLTTDSNEKHRLIKVAIGFLLFAIGLLLNFMIITKSIDAGISWEREQNQIEEKSQKTINGADSHDV